MLQPGGSQESLYDSQLQQACLAGNDLPVTTRETEVRTVDQEAHNCSKAVEGLCVLSDMKCSVKL